MQHDLLAEEFEAHRGHLRAVGYRMLGSVAEAEDAVQDAWLRLSRTDADEIDNLGGWLTTVVSRICLDQLRARKARREESTEDRFPDPVVTDDEAVDPEHEVVLSDSLGLAIMVVLDELGPAERLAFVLHDVFGMPFAEIAPIVERSADATKMLASRARRRVQDARRTPDPDLARQRAAVDAFQSAARAGDFEALLRVLDPDVVLRNAGVDAVSIVRGAAAVASGAITFQGIARVSRPVLVDGVAGVAVIVDGKIASLAAFTVVDDRIVEIDIVNDPKRLRGVASPLDAG
ncbi:MAG TPA: sigma-70 family RNA polymerase sigma factor [Nocardioides sp.]|nr:sigma-70 family RNA polymerase sigma factor [Nocardioides sp.]